MSGDPTLLATARLAGELRASLAEAPAEGAEWDDFALLAAHVDGELSAVEAEGVEAWLAADPEAAATAAALAALRRELVDERLPAPLPLRAGRPLTWAGLAAAAALVAAVGMSWLAGRPAPPAPGGSLARASAAPAAERALPPSAEIRAAIQVAETAPPDHLGDAPLPSAPPGAAPAATGGSRVVSVADFEDGTTGWETGPVILDFESGRLPASSTS